MKEVVFDASVALKWVLDEDYALKAAALRDDYDLHAPGHWLSEATHAIANSVRRGLLSDRDAERRVAILQRLPVRITTLDILAPRACRIAIEAGITGYDAFYVALAERLDVLLVTADQRLIRRLAETRVASGLVRFVGDLA